MGQRGDHRLLRQHPPSGGGRPLGTGDQPRGGQGPGQVGVQTLLGRARRGRPEVDHRDAGPRRIDQYRFAAQRTVSDTGPAQIEHCGEEGVQHVVGQLRRVELAQADARWGPDGQGGVAARTADAGHQHVRGGHTAPLGQKGHVCLVLDLLDPGERQSRPGVPVEEESARLGQQLGVGGVATIERHRHRFADVVDAGVSGHPPHLVLGRRHGADRHPEIGQHDGQLLSRGQAQGRPEHQVDERSRPPAEGHAGRNVHGEPVSGHHRGHGGQPDNQLDQALGGA